jgi:hypothetical protein
MLIPSRRWLLVSLAISACLVAPLAGPPSLLAAADLPASLTDQEYWGLVDRFSEANGYFQSDNLVGNERPLQIVVPTLKTYKRGGAYLGVAPDQNFTYIVALEPKIAFIVDIRRGNLLEQLMYKALIEQSADRADFVSRLFSKKRPEGLGPQSTAEDIFNAYSYVDTSAEPVYAENLRALDDWLTKHHGFPLSADDLKGIEYVYYNFYWFGPSISYSSSNPSGRRPGNMPSYADLQVATDGERQARGYLASEENFRILKTFEERNLLVPVVGDFAGPKALRAVGAYLADHGATVTAFYVSNVEQYLFQNGVWQTFYQNVATLPLDDASVFIRSARGSSVLDPIRGLIKDVQDGRIRTYADVTYRGGTR